MGKNDKTTASLGGKPLLLSAPVRWSLKSGTLPYVGTFDMAPADALEVSKLKKPIDLIITPPEGNPVKVEQLWALDIMPGERPEISKVTVSDRRWFWSYAHVLRRYNMRRNTGVKRILNNQGFVVNFDRAPQVAYAHYSLRNRSRRWAAGEIIEDVFGLLSDAEARYMGKGFRLKIDNRLMQKLKGLPVEDLVIDDAGDSAAMRSLSYLPEADVYVDYNGDVVVYAKSTGDEKKVIEALLPEVRGEGHTDLSKNNMLRPKEIHVLFTRKLELRTDFVEVASAATATVSENSESPLGTRRLMENVIPITDYQLLVPEIDSKPLAQGTWITVDQAFRAWGQLPLVGGSVAIDHALVQQAFIPQMDLWEALLIAGQQPDGKGTLRNWAARIAALQEHYRRTFRINRFWMDNLLSIEPYRLATIDPQSGQRGPARAWGDYSIMYTQRSAMRNLALGQRIDYAINKSGYPTGASDPYTGVPPLDDTADTSPAEVLIVDSDQGIISLDYRVDPNRVYEMILPSKIDDATMPSGNARQTSKSITFDSIYAASKPPKLSASFKVAVLLSGTPASPNTTQQLHRIVIKPADVKGLIPEGQQTGLDEANGPIMEIRVGAAVEVARIQWKEDRAKDIEKAFGILDGEPDLTGLVMNEGKVSGIEFGASLNSIALAQAAEIYASLVDHFEGSMTGYMNGGVKPAGWIGEITHEVRPLGEPLTKVTIPEKIPRLNMMSFLDSNSRQAILHTVEGGV